jgi:DNA repair photolyase
MPLNKSKGGMYDWVTHTHAHLGGECPHRCVYCFVDSVRFGRPEKYKGELRLVEKEFSVRYGDGRMIFIESCNDLFAADVPQDFINRVLLHCRAYPLSTYVFQTKNPKRLLGFTEGLLPPGSILGCTIETNRDMPEISKAPPALERAQAMRVLMQRNWKTFITVEPALDYDVAELLEMLCCARPSFVNVGADSKGHNLAEPSLEKVLALVAGLKDAGIEVREKHNLQRLTREA